MAEYEVKKVIRKERGSAQIDPEDPSKGHFATIVTVDRPWQPWRTFHFPAGDVAEVKKGDRVQIEIDDDRRPHLA